MASRNEGFLEFSLQHIVDSTSYNSIKLSYHIHFLEVLLKVMRQNNNSYKVITSLPNYFEKSRNKSIRYFRNLHIHR